MSRSAASSRTSGTHRKIFSMSNVLHLDGTTGRVDFGDVFGFERTQPVTLSLWCRFNNLNSSQELISKRLNTGTFRGWVLNLSSTGQLQVIIRTGATNAISVTGPARSVTPGVWNHIAMTYDGSSSAAGVILYLNGVAETLTISSDNLNATIITTGRASLGARNGGTDVFANGSFTNLRLYTSVLSGSEIANGYKNNVWPTSNLYALYLMSDASGLQLSDSGGGSYHGVLEGTVTWGTNGPMITRSAASGRSAA